MNVLFNGIANESFWSFELLLGLVLLLSIQFKWYNNILSTPSTHVIYWSYKILTNSTTLSSAFFFSVLRQYHAYSRIFQSVTLFSLTMHITITIIQIVITVRCCYFIEKWAFELSNNIEVVVVQLNAYKPTACVHNDKHIEEASDYHFRNAHSKYNYRNTN